MAKLHPLQNHLDYKTTTKPISLHTMKITLSFVHERQEPREAQDSTEDETGGDGYVGDDGKAFQGFVAEGGIDQVGVVMADKGCNNNSNSNNNNIAGV